MSDTSGEYSDTPSKPACAPHLPRISPSEHTASYSLSSEVDALDRMLRSFHLSLETLSLPSEPTPMHVVQLLDWPRLRELRLRGIHWTSPHDLITTVLDIARSFAPLRTLKVHLDFPEIPGPMLDGGDTHEDFERRLRAETVHCF
ncbi:hypothetical protein L226DRAFT_278533 [Lentinus tigrinus ALCF2SS1-7]|uniref:uncharacterized protein n=1 Tax=Lentinus tigrinus ALCF2SS1-7 TaxID=1328758 RepID=UPI0011661D83|nr:hypothetical protein L226DRAFT_278533 [Lentinus tigrinus ALCF2SS1-7]